MQPITTPEQGSVVTSPVTPESASSPSARSHRRAPRGSFARALAALALLITAATGIAFGGNQIASNFAGAQSSATLTVAGAQTYTQAPAAVLETQNVSDAAAVQAVIERANQAQVAAIAARDPSPAALAETAAGPYVQELQRTNQSLIQNGVAAIKLLGIEWGAVSVNGNSATATSYETWSTTFVDGSTEVSRDQNDYVLALDNGSWKIQSDVHPAAPQAPRAPNGTAPAPAPNPASPAPRPSVPFDATSEANTSNNWAGYAATGGRYTAVKGTWTVPRFAANATQGVDATWVGIGGVSSRDLVQAGTQQIVSGTGVTQYQAWIETLPQPSRPIALTVQPGDSITVTITEQGTNTSLWQVVLKNNTTGQTYEETLQYTSSRSSAEWVQEAPSTMRGGLLPLDDFGTVTMTDAGAQKDGQSVNLAGAGARAITMVSANRQALAVPSALDANGSGFSVTRTANPSVVAPTTRGFGPGSGSGSGSGSRGHQTRR